MISPARFEIGQGRFRVAGPANVCRHIKFGFFHDADFSLTLIFIYIPGESYDATLPPSAGTPTDISTTTYYRRFSFEQAIGLIISDGSQYTSTGHDVDALLGGRQGASI